MYLWSAKKLAFDIKNNLIKKEDWKNYYLAQSIVTLIAMYLAGLEPREGSIFMLVEVISVIVVTVIGVNITFMTNSPSPGDSYIPRVVAIGFPVLVNLIVAFILIYSIGLIGGFVLGVLNFESDMPEWLSLLMAVVAEATFFWRVNVHLKFINT